MIPILFEIGGVKFYTYGIFMIAGILVSCLVLSRLARTRRLRVKNLFDTVLLIALVGIVSARLVYTIFYWDKINNIWEFFYFWQQGMSIYGGIIGGGLFAYYYLKKQHENSWRWLDMMTIGLYAGWVVIGAGKYLGSEYVGSYTTAGDFYLTILEMFLASLIFLVLYFIWKNKVYIEGYVCLIGLTIFAFLRLVFGFVGETDSLWWIFSFEQMVSILLIIGCVILLFLWHNLIRPHLIKRLLNMFIKF